MDDASKIQQINNLARELMKSGQATTMEEAMQKAQAQMSDAPDPNREPAPPVSMEELQNAERSEGLQPEAERPSTEAPVETVADEPVVEQPAASESSQEESEPVVEQSAEEPTTPPAPEPEPAPTESDLDKLHAMVSQQESTLSSLTTTVQAHSDSIKEFNDKVNRILAEIADIKSKLDSATAAPASQPQAQQQPAPAPQSSPAPQQAEQKPEPKKDGSGHARSGNYNPEDVSIEKMFYYGNK